MASLRGVSANPTKQNHILGEDKVNYIAGPNLFLQRKENVKWKDLDANSPNPLKPDKKEYDEWGIKEMFDNK
ncbi:MULTISPECIES: hypothetical protein [Bacillus amyloliquefaciens group]|uniref:hypothetical protein n=1 Tax=Bacillus velezensis TaxID=492670 RepID=UPI0038627C20